MIKKLLLLIIMILSCGIAEAAVLRGNISPSGEMTVSGGYWECIYDDTLESAATTVDITGINGNVDEVYRLDTKIVGGYNGNQYYYVRLNGDSGSNYGRQSLGGWSSTYDAARAADAFFGFAVGATQTGLGELVNTSLVINAKSGSVRTCINQYTSDIQNKTVGQFVMQGNSWNNTADNITSLSINGNETNAIGIGSHIRLWRWKHD